MIISKLRLFLVTVSCTVLWYYIFVTKEENLPLEDNVIAEENAIVHNANYTTTKYIPVKVEATQAKNKMLEQFSRDPRCSIEGIVKKKGFDYDDDDTIGESDSLQLGPCQYAYPTRYPPKKGWMKEIDWFFFRKTHTAREQCFLDCLNSLPKEYIDNAMLIEASRMGLSKVTDRLFNHFHLDPMYKPPDSAEKPRVLNAIQEAIRGGYAEIVKILTRSNNDMEIDSYGRTVKDYVFAIGSPIRPTQVKNVLGLSMPSNWQTQVSGDEVTRGENNITYSESNDFGWSTSTSLPYNNDCDIDLINKDITPEFFFKEYFSTGRPFVMRNHVPRDELRAFRKKRWNQTESFHLSGKHRVGPTAYPSLTRQHYCQKKFTMLEIENGTVCPDMPDRKMVYAVHPDQKQLKELFPMYDGDVLDESGGWRNVGEWFGDHETDLVWQLDYGGDGSGATFHWNNAAFNTLYVGVKEWKITPPLYRGFTGMAATAAKEMVEDSYTLKCTQYPGDQIFIPDYWGQMTINHGFTIGAAVKIEDKQRKQIREKKKKKDFTKRKKEETLATVVEKTKRKKLKIPFLFIHINKTGGTSLITMFRKRCKKEYVSEWWGGHKGRPWHRSFHATADSYIRQYGRQVFDEAFTFAVVRHPLARQVSNFFFLAEMCEEEDSCSNSDRLIPKKVHGKPISKLSDEEKIQAFHDWILRLYEKYPPSSPKHYLFGSKGHGNEEWETFSSTQTSWLVDEKYNIVVKKTFKLEELSKNMDLLVEAIPCLRSTQDKEVKMIKKNKTSKYPDFMLFAENNRTREIIKEVYADDFNNFGYEL